MSADGGRKVVSLGQAASLCTACDLSSTRTQVVWGSGAVNARVMFVGEAPGRREDEGGEPFIGAAGRVLDEFLDAAALVRSEIYITNVVKCRPPKNRNPHPGEIQACKHWLEAQIDLIDPEVIVTLGAFASQTILETDQTIGALQGKVGQRFGRRVLALYHPAATIYDRTKREPLFQGAATLANILEPSSDGLTTKLDS